MDDKITCYLSVALVWSLEMVGLITKILAQPFLEAQWQLSCLPSREYISTSPMPFVSLSPRS